MIVSINPDEDPGFPGTTADPFIIERDLNLKVCAALHAALGRCGQDSRFDPAETLVEFIARVNGDGTELAIAIGHNAGQGNYACSILCPGGDSFGKQLLCAQEVVAAVGAELGIGTALFHEQLGVCCDVTCDGVFVEPLFMDNPSHQSLYHADVDGYAMRCGEAICKGIAAAYGFDYLTPQGGDSMAADLNPDDPTVALIVQGIRNCYNEIEVVKGLIKALPTGGGGGEPAEPAEPKTLTIPGPITGTIS